MGSACNAGCAQGPGGCCTADGADRAAGEAQLAPGPSRLRLEEIIHTAQWQDGASAKYMTPLSPAQEFTVLLQKTNLSQPLGLDVDVSDEQALVVERVHDLGALPTWNRKNPEYVVRAGDAIIEVNGISADAERMTLRCTRDEILELRVQRGGGPWRRSPVLGPQRPPGCMQNMCSISCLAGDGDIIT